MEVEIVKISNSTPVVIRKIDSKTRQKVDGAVFEIYLNHQKQFISSAGMLLSAAQVAEKIGMPVNAEGAEAAMEEKEIASTFTIGEITLKGIQISGTYTLSEKKSPAGYIITDNESTFTVTKEQGTVSITTEGANVKVAEDGITIEVENEPGATLPNSGGPGTTMMYLIGIMLTAFASILLMMRNSRRKV